MPGKMARSDPGQPLGATPMKAVIRAASPSCQNTGKPREFTRNQRSYGDPASTEPTTLA